MSVKSNIAGRLTQLANRIDPPLPAQLPPVDKSMLRSLSDITINHFIDATRAGQLRPATIGGQITKVSRCISRKGTPWAIVTLADETGIIQCKAFGRTVKGIPRDFGAVVRVHGRPELDDGFVSLIIDDIRAVNLNDVDERPVVIAIPETALARDNMIALGNTLMAHLGYCEVHLAIVDNHGNARILAFGNRFRVKREDSLFNDIRAIFGSESVKAQ